MEKEVVLRYRGTEENIDFAIDVLAKRGGYRLLTEEEINSGKIQLSKETVALEYVTSFIRETVQQESIKVAKLEAAKIAAELEAQVLSATKSGLDVITKSLEVVNHKGDI